MSSLRNAVKRITHKERSQPQARAHLGILEKKKDYKERADHFHRREDRIQAMQRKASMRNPDEFYFGMHNAQVKDGHHKKTQEAVQKELEDQIGAEAVRVMKDQDLAYVRMQKQKDSKKADQLKAALHFLDTSSPARKKSKHTVFVDTKEQADEFDVVKHFGTVPQFSDRAFNRPRASKLREEALEIAGRVAADPYEYQPTSRDLKLQEQAARKVVKAASKARLSSYGEMEARSRRATVMEMAEAHLVTEKLVAGKGRKRKIKAAEGGKPAQYKWRRKRNR